MLVALVVVVKNLWYQKNNQSCFIPYIAVIIVVNTSLCSYVLGECTPRVERKKIWHLQVL